MKYLKFINCFLLLLWWSSISFCQSIETAQDALIDGDLRIGGGNVTFIDDINGGSPKVVSINNSLGNFEISTLGTPGGVLTLLRDGGLLLKNRDNNEIIEFEVTDNGTFKINDGAGGPTRMVINPDGVIGLGTGTIDAVARVNIKQGVGQKALLLESTNILDYWTVEVDNSADYVWRYQASSPGAYIDLNDGANYKTFSDGRLKSNIENVPDVLSKVLQLRATNYNFKNVNSNHKTIGFIAQEVEKLFPELVGEKEGYKSLSYASFSVLAVKAIQEQQSKIESLEERLAALEEK